MVLAGVICIPLRRIAARQKIRIAKQHSLDYGVSSNESVLQVTSAVEEKDRLAFSYTAGGLECLEKNVVIDD